MKRTAFFVIISFLTLYASVTVYASDGLFDGKRKGFIFGVGIGPSVELDRGSDEREFSSGSASLGLRAITGYGITDRILLYNTSRYGSFSVTRRFYEDTSTINTMGMSAGIGIMYFPSAHFNLYLRGNITASVALSQWTNDEISRWIDGGFEGAIGFEVFPRVTFDVSLSLNRYWSDSDYSYNTGDSVNCSITISRLFY